jgi:hypothetical protein
LPLKSVYIILLSIQMRSTTDRAKNRFLFFSSHEVGVK